jgi:hypothetical protein
MCEFLSFDLLIGRPINSALALHDTNAHKVNEESRESGYFLPVAVVLLAFSRDK